MKLCRNTEVLKLPLELYIYRTLELTETNPIHNIKAKELEKEDPGIIDVDPVSPTIKRRSKMALTYLTNSHNKSRASKIPRPHHDRRIKNPLTSTNTD